MAKNSYNNTMHSIMPQTLFFANNGLHPRFDIRGVDNVMNLATED
jgi:hypothetical protein